MSHYSMYLFTYNLQGGKSFDGKKCIHHVFVIYQLLCASQSFTHLQLDAGHLSYLQSTTQSTTPREFQS